MSKVAGFILTLVSSIMTTIVLLLPFLFEFRVTTIEVYYGAIGLTCLLWVLWLLTICEYLEA